MQAARRPAWQLWWPFALLCLLRGSRWMLSESLPGSATTLASASLGCGSAAALYLLILRPSSVMREQRSDILRSAIGGALLITGPLTALLYPRAIAATSLTMALALTPVVIAVGEAATRHSSETLAGRLWPGLAAIAGLLLLLHPTVAHESCGRSCPRAHAVAHRLRRRALLLRPRNHLADSSSAAWRLCCPRSRSRNQPRHAHRWVAGHGRPRCGLRRARGSARPHRTWTAVGHALVRAVRHRPADHSARRRRDDACRVFLPE